MPYEPIHHKYRPQTFKQLVGQETIALTLNNALKQDKIAPAYLFTGPRGTGKTSSARILAKSLNCLAADKPTPDPCGKCEVCVAIANGSALDVMEIDAASNTGVDNIREIIERSRFAPVQCRYKIYAIDECHMLSTAAFNALLKTLEEPPPQVVFILATTDPQRVLSTIISRCQRFDYRRIPLTDMVGHLKYIAAEEKIAIADDALTLVAQIANGGLRDAESLLDQLSLLPDTITVEKVWDLVGAVPEQDLLKLLHCINGNNSLGVLEQCRNLLDRGREPIVVLQNLANFYLNLLIAKTAPQRPDLVAVTETCWQQLCEEAANWHTSSILQGQQHLKEAENQLKRTTQPRLWLEVTLLGLLPQAQQKIVVSQPEQSAIPENNNHSPRQEFKSSVAEPSDRLENEIEVKNKVTPSIIKTESPEISAVKTTTNETVESSPTVSFSTPSEEAVKETSPITPTNFDLENIWTQVIKAITSRMTQELLKQQCHLMSFEGSSAIVGIGSATLQKLNQNKVPIIEKAFATVIGHNVRVQLEVATTKNIPQKSAKSNHSNDSITPQPPDSPKVATFVPPAKPNSFTPPQNNSTNREVSTPIKTSETLDTENNAQKPVNPDSAIANPASREIATTPEHNSPIPFPQETEANSTGDPKEQLMEKAIANLTQTFEGELIEMGDRQPQLGQETATQAFSENNNLEKLNPEDIEF